MPPRFMPSGACGRWDPLAGVADSLQSNFSITLSDPGIQDLPLCRPASCLPPDVTTILPVSLLERHELGRGRCWSNQRPSGIPGTVAQGRRTICGRQHHRGAVLDEEPVRGEGVPEIAPDKESLKYFGMKAHIGVRCGYRDSAQHEHQSGSTNAHDVSRGAQSAARRGDASVVQSPGQMRHCRLPPPDQDDPRRTRRTEAGGTREQRYGGQRLPRPREGRLQLRIRRY